MASAAAESANGQWTAMNQLMVQLLGIGATIALAAIGTICICWIVEKTLGFRIDEEKEIDGLDYSLHGEHGYGLINS